MLGNRARCHPQGKAQGNNPSPAVLPALPSISSPISLLQPHLVGNKYPSTRHAWPGNVSSQHLISHCLLHPDRLVTVGTAAPQIPPFNQNLGLGSPTSCCFQRGKTYKPIPCLSQHPETLLP